MKPTVTQTKFLTLLTVLTVVASINLRADSAGQKRGSDVLHYTVRATMTTEAVAPEATGIVHLQHKAQGKVTQEMLTISLRGLEPNGAYRLVVPAVDAASSPTLVADFTTDRKGKASLRYKQTTHANANASSNGNGKAKGYGKSKGKQSLPAPVAPLTAVDKLSVIDAAGVTILTVDLNATDKFVYLLKRDISTATVRAYVKLISTQDSAVLTLNASGLIPSTDYSLKLNGGTPEVFTTDAEGRLIASVTLENPADILQVGTVELLDAASVVVLSATLP